MTNNTQKSLDLLLTISRDLATTLDLHTVLARVLSISTSHLKAERGSLIVLDDESKPIDAAIVYINRIIPEITDQLKSTLDQGLAGWVVRNQKPVLLNDTSVDGRWLHREDDNLDNTGPKSAICIPLTAREKVVGVLTIVHPETDFFTTEHLSLLQSIADQSGSAIYNARLYDSLQAAHLRYHELFDDSIEPIIITDLNGLIIEANKQAELITKTSLNKLIGKNISDIHEPDFSILGNQYSDVNDKNTIIYESDLLLQKHDQIPVEIHVRSINIESKSYFQWFIKDITERKELDHMREDMIAMIYHDLRSPLANTISSLEILKTQLDIEKDKNVNTLLDIAERSTDRMQRLINSLLDINRLENGKAITNKKECNINALISESVDIIKSNLDSKEQKIKIHTQDTLEDIKIDIDMVKRVVINLLENASKFTPDEGLITIGSNNKKDEILIWVEDNGPGIPKESIEKIFNKYTRLDRKNMPKGLGLGLAFCKLAVEAHGGKIWAESKENVGSKFIFSIPK